MQQGKVILLEATPGDRVAAIAAGILAVDTIVMIAGMNQVKEAKIRAIKAKAQAMKVMEKDMPAEKQLKIEFFMGVGIPVRAVHQMIAMPVGRAQTNLMARKVVDQRGHRKVSLM